METLSPPNSGLPVLGNPIFPDEASLIWMGRGQGEGVAALKIETP
jgi:hypothetical protein